MGTAQQANRYRNRHTRATKASHALSSDLHFLLLFGSGDDGCGCGVLSRCLALGVRGLPIRGRRATLGSLVLLLVWLSGLVLVNVRGDAVKQVIDRGSLEVLLQGRRVEAGTGIARSATRATIEGTPAVSLVASSCTASTAATTPICRGTTASAFFHLSFLSRASSSGWSHLLLRLLFLLLVFLLSFLPSFLASFFSSSSSSSLLGEAAARNSFKTA